MPDTTLSDQLIANSVTKDELSLLKPQDGMVRVMIGAWSGMGTSTIMQLLPDLPQFWSQQRDNILVSTVRVESHWAQAVGLAVSTFLTRSWDVDGEKPLLQLERARKRIRGIDYIGSFSQMITDFILRDAGAFIEVIRPTSSPTGVIGLNYLNAARCMPTGYPPIPVVYWDRLGHPHELRDYQVMRFTDMIDGQSPLGIGMCAASRAYNDIRLYAAEARYRLEKVTGNRPLAVHFLTGLSPQQVKGPLQDSAQQKEADNIIAFGGVVLVPFIQRGDISHVEIPISALPDNFSNKEEVQMTSVSYGNALPLITYLDVMPMTGQRAGSGAQSQVIDDSKSNKEAILRDITLKINDQELWKIMPEGVTFSFVKNDLADKKREADIINIFATAAAHLIKDCGLDQGLILKWLVDNDVLPPDDNPAEAFGQLDSSSNASTNNVSRQPYAGLANEKPAVSGDATTALSTKPTLTKVKGQLSDAQLSALGNELRTIYRSQHEVAPERIRELVDAYRGEGD